MSVTVVGIDIGITGAFAVLYGDSSAVLDLPVKKKPNSNKNMLDGLALAVALIEVKKLAPQTVAFVESVHASPQMGVTSSFSLGHSRGVVEGVLACLGIESVSVSPQEWKGAMGLIVKGNGGRSDFKAKKLPAIELARKLYPNLYNRLNAQKYDGRADALLIAHYGAETLGI